MVMLRDSRIETFPASVQSRKPLRAAAVMADGKPAGALGRRRPQALPT